MTLVDTNVLLDLLDPRSAWGAWSLAELDEAGSRGPRFINAVVFAEISVAFGDVGDCEAFLGSFGLTDHPIPRRALFLAGQAFRDYRRRGGARTGVLPDFFIGAHALVEGWPLLTRDAGRYRTAFPGLTLITP